MDWDINLSHFAQLDKINVANNGLSRVPDLPPTTLALNISFNSLNEISTTDFRSVYNLLILVLKNCSITHMAQDWDRSGLDKNFQKM